MKIKLIHDEQVLFESTLPDLPSSVIIGRRRGCDWLVPKSFSMVSGTHAKLQKRGDHVFIQDLESRNGILFHGERVQERELAVGDRLELGNCVLVVEEEGPQPGFPPPKPPRAAAVAAPPAQPSPVQSPQVRIVCESGDLKGQAFPIGSTLFTIGSDPASSLCIPNSMVSHHHAEIEPRAGQYLIRDLGSTNETLVNNKKLMTGDEVALKAGDRIFVAHISLVFDDGTRLKTARKYWYASGGGGLVLAILLALCFRACSPSAERILRQARELAAEEQFDAALALLRTASDARGGEQSGYAIEDLTQQVSTWKSACDMWQQTRDDLQAGKWDTAAKSARALKAKDERVWTWNPKAAELGERVLRVNRLVEAFLSADKLVGRGYMDHEIIRKRQEALIDAMGRFNSPPPYLSRLIRDANTVKTELTKMLLQEGIPLPGLEKQPPELAELLEALDQRRKMTTGEKRKQLDALVQALRGVADTADQYRQIARDMQGMRFDAVIATKLTLPAESLCAVDGRILEARRRLSDAHMDMVSTAKILAKAMSVLRPEGGDLSPMVRWDDSMAVNRVLACDTMDLPPVDASRTSNVGEYDRYLGVEDFYAFCVRLRGKYRLLKPLKTPFDTVMDKTAGFLETAIKTLASLKDCVDKDWYAGSLRAWVDDLGTQVAVRDKVVARMLAGARDGKGRQALIAAGIALQLAEDPDKLAIDGKPLRQWTIDAFEQNQSDVRKLAHEYDRETTEGLRGPIRSKVLALALPGDSLIASIRKPPAE